MKKKKFKKKTPNLKYKGKIKLMSRGPDYIWVEWYEIKLKTPFSWKLVNP